MFDSKTSSLLSELSLSAKCGGAECGGEEASDVTDTELVKNGTNECQGNTGIGLPSVDDCPDAIDGDDLPLTVVIIMTSF